MAVAFREQSHLSTKEGQSPDSGIEGQELPHDSAPPERPDSTAESHVLFNTALGQIQASNYRDALVHLMGALRIAPGNAQYLSYFGLCVAYVDQDFERAVDVCMRALKEARKDPMLFINLGRVYRLRGDNRAAYKQFQRAWRLDRRHPATAAELTRMGIRRPPFIRFISRHHWLNRHLGWLRAELERRIVGHRQL
jgi:tetratricopeptide (TPR) repeat protein